MFSLRSEKTLTVLLLSNHREWKADFINFYLVRLQNLTSDTCRDTIYCTNKLTKNMFLSCGKRDIKEPIRASFKYKDQTITFVSPSGFEERKKHHWRKIMSEVGHVDAVICMLSKDFKTDFVMSVIDVLLEYVEKPVFERMYFINGDNTIPLENINALIGAKLNVVFGEEDKFQFNFPMFKKQLILEQRGMQLGAAYKRDVEQAVKTFQFVFEDLVEVKKSNSIFNRTFTADVGRPLKMLGEFFESLCDAFVLYEVETIQSLLKKAEKKVVIFCSCYEVVQGQNNSNEKSANCTCTSNKHRSEYYKKMFEYLLPESSNQRKSDEAVMKLRRNLGIFESLTLLVVRFLINITGVRKEIVKDKFEIYGNYLMTKMISHPYKDKYNLLYQLYIRKLKTYKCEDPKGALLECFNNLTLAPAPFKELLQANFDAEKLAHIKRYYCPPPEVKTAVTQPVASTTVDNVIGPNLLNSIVDTIKEFSNELRDLRKMCAQNEIAIGTVAGKLRDVQQQLINKCK